MARQNWQSNYAFVVSSAGAAVGLGTFIIFPYFVAKLGSGFVYVYCLSMVLFGLPVTIAEAGIGCLTRENLYDSLSRVGGFSGRCLAIWSMFTLFILLSFYSIISGWALSYLGASLTSSIPFKDIFGLQEFWSYISNDFSINAISSTCFLILVHIMVALGLKSGIEKLNKILMPFLLLMFIVLLLYLIALYPERINYALYKLFSFNLLNINSEIILIGLGQAFFVMATGAGCMLTYGSFVPEKDKLLFSICLVCFFNLLLSILSSLVIFGFLSDAKIYDSYSLVYISIPYAIKGFIAVNFWLSIFFLLLFIAAITSAVSLLEPLVDVFSVRFGKGRGFINICLFIPLFLILLLLVTDKSTVVLSYNLFDLVSDLPQKILLPIGVFGYCLFFYNIMDNLKYYDIKENFNLPKIFIKYIGLICPLVLMFILFNNLLN